VVSFTPQPLYPHGKSPQFPLWAHPRVYEKYYIYSTYVHNNALLLTSMSAAFDDSSSKVG